MPVPKGLIFFNTVNPIEGCFQKMAKSFKPPHFVLRD